MTPSCRRGEADSVTEPRSIGVGAGGAYVALVRHLANGLSQALPPTQAFGLRRLAWSAGRVGMAADTKICGGAVIYGRGQFEIGPATWISPGLRAFTHVEAPIVIGARCDIGPNVSLMTGSHEIGDCDRRAGPGTARPIVIGDGCWIGAGAMILGGVTIGEGSIVGAGSVVIRDIPAHTLSAGVPAVEKRQLA
jgi:maltose O-acetyltransferase